MPWQVVPHPQYIDWCSWSIFSMDHYFCDSRAAANSCGKSCIPISTAIEEFHSIIWQRETVSNAIGRSKMSLGALHLTLKLQLPRHDPCSWIVEALYSDNCGRELAPRTSQCYCVTKAALLDDPQVHLLFLHNQYSDCVEICSICNKILP